MGSKDLHHAQFLTHASPTRLSVVLLKEVRRSFVIMTMLMVMIETTNTYVKDC